MFFVYIIYSKSGNCYYRGFSENPKRRLGQHNNAESTYTSKYNDWVLLHIEVFGTKSEALKREKSLKKYSKNQVLELINSSKNQIDTLQ